MRMMLVCSQAGLHDVHNVNVVSSMWFGRTPKDSKSVRFARRKSTKGLELPSFHITQLSLMLMNKPASFASNSRQHGPIQGPRATLTFSGLTLTLCTSCNPELFYSHRRDHIPFGNQVGFIGLR
jgi:hypothetical protein